MDNVSPRGLSPFLNIWFSPRATVRAIVDVDPRLHVTTLAMVAGGLSALPGALIAAGGAGQPTLAPDLGPIGVATVTVLGALVGVIALYISGWLLAVAGRQLGGVAPALHVRTAIAWSNVPSIVGSAIAVAALVTGAAAITDLEADGVWALEQRLTGPNLIVLALGLWSFIISLHAIGEVHGFSAWRALAAWILVLVEVALAIVALLVLMVYLAGVELS
jgi:hypothetical protein